MAIPERSRPARLRLWLAVTLIVAGSVGAMMVWGPSLYRFVADQEQVRSWAERLGPWGALGIIVLEVAQILLAPLPGQTVGVASGYLFGPFRGTVYAMAGLMAGSLLVFLLARHLGRPLLRRLIGERTMARLDTLAHGGGALFFLLVWLVPFVPDDVACFAAGLTKISTGQFLLLVAVGRLPGVLLSTWLGANVTRLGFAWWTVGVSGLAVVAVLVWWRRQPLEAAMLRLTRWLAGDRRT